MKKVSKAILIGLAVLAGLGVAIVVGLNLYIQSPGSQARIQEELSKALRLPLKLTNVSVSPFGTLRITGITIPNGGVNFLDAASFTARYRLLPLLHGKLVIPEMNVESPKIVWMQEPDGKWKLPEPEQAKDVSAADANQKLADEQKSGQAEGKKSSFTVDVQRFEVKSGSVELFDNAKKHVAVLSDVNMTYTSLTSERVEGTATIGKAVWTDSFTFENVSAPFKYTAEALNLPETLATFAGGSVRVVYHSRTEKHRAPYKVAVSFSKLDLDRLGAQMGGAPGQTTGSLTGQVEIHGDTLNPSQRDGEGRADVRDAQFHQLDLFQNIGQVLGLRELSDLRVRDGHADLKLSGEKIRIEKLTLNTSDLQLSAQGTARLDKKLSLDAQLSVEEAVVQRLPAMIRDSFVATEGGRRAITFEISGTTDKPKTNLLDKLIGQKINSQFGDVLGSLFGDKKPEEKPKKDDKKDKKKKDKDKPVVQDAAIVPAPAPATPPPAAAPQPQPATPNP